MHRALFWLLYVLIVCKENISVLADSGECPWVNYCGADSLNITGTNSACICDGNKPICGPGPWFNCLTCTECPTCNGCDNNNNNNNPPPTPLPSSTGNSNNNENCICNWSDYCGSDSCGRTGIESSCKCNTGDICSGTPQYNCIRTNNSVPIIDVDFVVWRKAAVESMFIDYVNFTTDGCAYIEGIIHHSGQRKLLKFGTQVHNLGSQNFELGDPYSDRNKELFHWSECHQHHHLTGWADYTLYNNEWKEVAIGHKQGFCLRDSLRVNGKAGEKKYTCEYQGISANWGDLYDNKTDGQWVDITDLPSGSYTLRITVNPARVFQEKDFNNNSIDIDVTIP